MPTEKMLKHLPSSTPLLFGLLLTDRVDSLVGTLAKNLSFTESVRRLLVMSPGKAQEWRGPETKQTPLRSHRQAGVHVLGGGSEQGVEGGLGASGGRKNFRVQGSRVGGLGREDCLAYLPGFCAIILHNDF